MWGVQSDFASPFLTLDKYSSWRVERVVPMIRSAVQTTLCSLLRSDLVADLHQMVIDMQKTDSLLLKSTIIYCFEHVKFQVVKTLPDSQLNLLAVSRLITVLNEADRCCVICMLQELDRGVFRCAVICVQGEEQWGENTALRSSSAKRMGAGWKLSQPYYLLPVIHEAGDPLTDGGGDGELCQFILKGFRDDGVKSWADIYT